MKQINVLLKRLALACAVAACAASLCGAQTPAADNKQQPGASEKAAAPVSEKTAEKASALEEELSRTPAGKTVAKFLAAFNSGDLKTMRAFHESTGGDPENADKDLEFYEQIGGLKPHSLTSSTKDNFVVLVQTKKDARWISFEFTVGTQAPYGINSLRARPASAPAQ